MKSWLKRVFGNKIDRSPAHDRRRPVVRLRLEELETRVVPSATVQFNTAGETVNQSAGTFSIPVSLTGTPGGTPVVTTFASGFNGPDSIAINSAGYVFVANLNNSAINEVTPAGVVSTFATGFSTPDGMAFSAAGNLYVANVGGDTVSEVTPAGAVSTFASGFNNPQGLAFNAAGDLFVANEAGNTVSEVTPGGVVSSFASGFNHPIGLAVNTAGDLFVGNNGANTVSEVTPGGVVSTFATGFTYPQLMAFDASGNLYVPDSGTATVSVVTPAGVVSTFSSAFNNPIGLAFNPAGNLFVVNNGNNTVSEVTSGVSVLFTLGGSAVSGTDFSGVSASPLTFGIGQSSANITGTLLPDPGAAQTLTFTLGTPTGATLGSPAVNTLTINEPAAPATVQFSAGSETVNASAGTFSIPVTMTGTPTGPPAVSTFASGFDEPTDLAFHAGNLYVGNVANNTVSEVTPAGVVSTFASGFSDPQGLAFDAAGNLYVAN